MTPHDFAALTRLMDASDICWVGRDPWDPADFADCGCSPPAAEFMAAALNALPDLLAVVRVLADIIARIDKDGEPFVQSPEDAALELQARAALARFSNIGEVRS